MDGPLGSGWALAERAMRVGDLTEVGAVAAAVTTALLPRGRFAVGAIPAARLTVSYSGLCDIGLASCLGRSTDAGADSNRRASRTGG